MTASIVGVRDVVELAEDVGESRVSIFLPTHRAGSETAQDPIRFRNLLGQVEGRLRSDGMRTPAIGRLLRPGRDLLGRAVS